MVAQYRGTVCVWKRRENAQVFGFCWYRTQISEKSRGARNTNRIERQLDFVLRGNVFVAYTASTTLDCVPTHLVVLDAVARSATMHGAGY